MTRPRLRDLGVAVGTLSPGPLNAITDVPGVWVGHTTVIRDEPRVVRTGVTMVVPRENEVWEDYCFGGWFRFNGNGELTGLPWLEESGMLGSPVAITNTNQVGLVRDALERYAAEHGVRNGFFLPVVGETWDGWLSDINAFPLTEEDARAALRSAGPGPVAEGNVGGGTGMICHDFKGGIGTASRCCQAGGGAWTVGALVQANYGDRADLRLDGVPLGRLIGCERVPGAYQEPPNPGGSIIVVVATDAPLIPTQCNRLARRATVGLARAGGVGHDGSGDLFLAFATGNHLPGGETRRQLEMLDHGEMDPLFTATAEAVEEAIHNALCAAETMTGFRGHTAHALPLDALAEAWAARPW